jgi:hypothetical protein
VGLGFCLIPIYLGGGKNKGRESGIANNCVMCGRLGFCLILTSLLLGFRDNEVDFEKRKKIK